MQWRSRKRRRERGDDRRAAGRSSPRDAAAPPRGRRVEVDADTWRRRELLAVLDLRGEVTAQDIGRAYRRLAKEHHPDHYVEADRATQAFHAARMRRIIDAYTSLRQLERA